MKAPSNKFNPEPHNKWKPKEQQDIVQILPTPKVNGYLHKLLLPDPKSMITHFFLPLSVSKGTGNKAWAISTQNFTSDQNYKEDISKSIRLTPSTMEVHHVIRGKKVKEKPPDPSTQHQPPNQMMPQGKILYPQTIPDTNLLSLHVGSKILRTKSSQEGGNDEDIRRLIDQLEHLECTQGSVGQVHKPLANKPPDKGDMANQDLKLLQDRTNSSGHLLALKVHCLRHLLPEDEDPGRPVEDEGLSSHHKAFEEHLATIFGKPSIHPTPADYDHQEHLFGIQEAYIQEGNSQDAAFWDKSHFGHFSPKPSPLRQVGSQLAFLFFGELCTTFEDSKGTRDYHLISWLYWIARRIKI